MLTNQSTQIPVTKSVWNKTDVNDLEPILSRLSAIFFALNGDYHFILEQKNNHAGIKSFSELNDFFRTVCSMLRRLDEAGYPLIKEICYVKDNGTNSLLYAFDSWLYYYLTRKANQQSRERLQNFLGQSETERILGPWTS